MTKYTLGFIFNEDLSKVILIYLSKPGQWNDKLFNGVGGHIDGDEVPCYGMVRECQEETGLSILAEKWSYAGLFHSDKFEIYTFCTKIPEKDFEINVMDEGVTKWRDLERLSVMNTATNTKWMIPLCIDLLQNRIQPFNIKQ